MKKSILITGANGGIGQALCKIFSANGFYVLATDRDELSKCKCDLYVRIELERYPESDILRNELVNAVRGINNEYSFCGLINNAAHQVIKSVKAIELADVVRTYNVNLYSPIFIIQDLLDILAGNQGSIVNISSVHSRLTKENFSVYASSKAALSAFTRALAIEIGERVRVNAIEPGAIETEMLKEGFVGKTAKYEELKSYQPSKRIGKVEDVAKIALNMICDFDYMNGTCIQVDGGISARLHDPD